MINIAIQYAGGLVIISHFYPILMFVTKCISLHLELTSLQLLSSLLIISILVEHFQAKPFLLHLLILD
jgi:hypothetical protein